MYDFVNEIKERRALDKLRTFFDFLLTVAVVAFFTVAVIIGIF